MLFFENHNIESVVFLCVCHHLASVFADEAAAAGAPVAAPVQEDLNEEEDEAPVENALTEAAAPEKKAAKKVAKQQKITWIGDSQTGIDGKLMYRCLTTSSVADQPLPACDIK